ncbi:Cytochrome P450 27C1 [Bienertia sinuspersici]
MFSDASLCYAVIVEEIHADQSGCSFFIKLLDGETFYFWCYEKSKLVGSDLLLKNLLKRKPTLAELTGITSSSTVAAPWADVRVDGFEVGRNTQSSIFWSNSEREYTISSQSRVLNSLRSALREKVRRPRDLHLPVGSSFMTEAVLKLSKEVKPPEAFTNNDPPLSFLESLGNCSFPDSTSSTA